MPRIVALDGVTLIVPDVEAAKRFYRGELAFRVSNAEDGRVLDADLRTRAASEPGAARSLLVVSDASGPHDSARLEGDPARHLFHFNAPEGMRF